MIHVEVLHNFILLHPLFAEGLCFTLYAERKRIRNVPIIDIIRDEVLHTLLHPLFTEGLFFTLYAEEKRKRNEPIIDIIHVKVLHLALASSHDGMFVFHSVC